MDSTLLVRIHTVSVILFLLTYLVKTILLFSNKKMLEKYARATKVPEMIISFLFLATGIWLFVILGGIKVLHIIKLIFVFVSIPLAIIGFKKMKKGLALISFFLIVMAYGLAEMSRSKPFLPAKAVSVNGAGTPFSAGAVVYQSNCVFCHGADGKKMYRNAPDLTASRYGDDGIMQMIREGSRGKMPAYSGVLSEEDITSVAEYVKGLRPLIISPTNEN
jgi:cytochrome c553